MVARSAYAQLRYSPLLLAGTVAGMALTYLAPPLLALFAHGIAQIFGIAAWGLMALAFQPTLRLYRPVAAVGTGAAGHRAVLHAVHARFRAAIRPRQGRTVEGPRSGQRDHDQRRRPTLRSGKGHRDENFPVASRLIASAPPRRRSSRSTNSCASPTTSPTTPTLKPDEKLALLDRLEAGLLGQHDEHASRRVRCARRCASGTWRRATPRTS